MNNLRTVNVRYAFPCLKMMSNLPPFFSYFLLFFALFAVALRNFTIHLKTQLILKEATPNCIWLDYYYLFSGLSAYYLEFLCISQSCIFVNICPVTNYVRTILEQAWNKPRLFLAGKFGLKVNIAIQFIKVLPQKSVSKICTLY